MRAGHSRVVLVATLAAFLLGIIAGPAEARFSALQNFYVGAAEDGLRVCRDGAIVPVAFDPVGEFDEEPTEPPDGMPEVVVPYAAEFPSNPAMEYPPAAADTIASGRLVLPFDPVIINAPAPGEPTDPPRWVRFSAEPMIPWTAADGTPRVLDVNDEVNLYFDTPSDDPDFASTFVTVENCWLFEEPTTEVTIDIRPASKTNAVIPWSRLPIPVAVLSTAEFDARDIDRSSLRFEGASARWSFLLDVNHDRKRDLVAGFRARDTDIVCGDTSATLTGTADGATFEGTGAILTVGCGHHGKH